MTLRGQDLPEPRAKGGSEILRLAGFFRNDQCPMVHAESNDDRSVIH